MDIPEEPEYNRNKWARPKSLALAAAFYKKWRETWKGPAFSYEYHFWRHQFLDPGGMALARRLYEDVRSLKDMGINGMVEDASQRSGFPNAFPVYIYAETLMNRDCDFEKVREDYFAHIYGPDWKAAQDLLRQISDVDSREEFRKISYAGLACKKTIKGQGLMGYRQAILYLKDFLQTLFYQINYTYI